ADSVELVVRGHLMDAFVGISGCDKTIPAMVMAMARLDLPSVMLYGGSILYGEYKGRRLTIQDVFEAVGAFNAGKIDAQELGATDAVLHLLAVAKEAGVKLTIDEFDPVSRRTPLLADLKPWGSYTAPEMYAAGGMAVVAKRLLDAGLLNATEMTVTGRTIGDEAGAARETPGQKVIRPLANPIARHGGIAILRGNLAPEGCVAKVAGHAEE